MNIKKRENLVQISARVPPDVREWAKALAKEKDVTESDIYRHIIGSFFESSVNKMDTSLYT